MKRALYAAVLFCSVLAGVSAPAAQSIERLICVWDIGGNAGPAMNAMRDWQVAAQEWGLKANLKPYTHGGIAAEDLKAEGCDAALITGLRARQFNKYTGTIDSVGGLPTSEHMKLLQQVLSDPGSAEAMTQGDYSVIGVMPAGAVYIFVNDREINTLAKAVGKRVAVLEFDKTQAIMVSKVGATPVSSDISNFSAKFNHGAVDVIFSPLVAYTTLELYEGLIPDGGIINYPMMQLSVQLVARKDRFSEEMMQKSRRYFYDRFDHSIEVLEREAEAVDEKWWVEIPDKDKAEYEVMLNDVSTMLQERGYYDAEMLKLQRRIRCMLEPNRAECT